MTTEQKSLDNLEPPEDFSMPSACDVSFRSDDEGDVDGGSATSTSKSDSSADHNTPNALVKRENQTVNISRAIMIFLLIGATIATALFVFRFTRDGEEEAYDDAFHNVASKLTSSLVSDTSLKVRIVASFQYCTSVDSCVCLTYVLFNLHFCYA